MVVVFFGTPQFAVPTLQHLLDSRHRVSGVVTQPDRPRGRGQKVTDGPVKALAIQHGLAVIQPGALREPSVAETIQSWQPDIGVVVAYGRLIPESLLAIPRSGMINVHASLLPRYRGAAPIHRAVIDGETETGVTIMRIDAGLDTGDILKQVKLSIGPEETAEELSPRLAKIGATALVDVIANISSLQQVKQDDSQATVAPQLKKRRKWYQFWA